MPCLLVCLSISMRRITRGAGGAAPFVASPLLSSTWLECPAPGCLRPDPETQGHGAVSVRGPDARRSPPGPGVGRGGKWRGSAAGGSSTGMRMPSRRVRAERQSRAARRFDLGFPLSRQCRAPVWWGPGADRCNAGGRFPVPRRRSAWPAAHGPGTALAAEPFPAGSPVCPRPCSYDLHRSVYQSLF